MTANLLVGYEFMNRKSANGRNLSVNGWVNTQIIIISKIFYMFSFAGNS
jgi:hypothetical protein